MTEKKIFNTVEYDSTMHEAFKRGLAVKKIFGTINKNSDIVNGSYLIIAHSLEPNCVIHNILISNSEMSDFTDAKFLFLKSNSKDIVDADIKIADNISFATVRSKQDILSEDFKGKSIAQILKKGVDALPASVDIAITSDAVGASIGSVSVEIEFSSPL